MKHAALNINDPSENVMDSRRLETCLQGIYCFNDTSTLVTKFGKPGIIQYCHGNEKSDVGFPERKQPRFAPLNGDQWFPS